MAIKNFLVRQVRGRGRAAFLHKLPKNAKLLDVGCGNNSPMLFKAAVNMPGDAANVATLGAQVTLIGVTGDDAAAADLRAQLASIPSIDARLIPDGSRPTTVKARHVADRQQMLRADVESTAPLNAS